MSSRVGLELWLTGVPAELDAAARMLGRLGTVAYHSPRHALSGVDAGRFRLYVRLYVSTSTAPAAPTPAEPQRLALNGQPT